MSARPAAELYEDDFYAWTRLQAKELRRFARSRPNLPLDLAHIAEEIADLGKSRCDSLRSWTRRIVEHLLLLEHAPARDPRRDRTAEVIDLRGEIEDRMTATLRRDLQRQLPLLYDRACRDLRRKLEPYGEAGIVDRFPEGCPYSLGQVLGDFWPEATHDRDGSA